MPDEATSHAIDLIENAALGHRFILEQFGILPRVGWQIGRYAARQNKISSSATDQSKLFDF